jgi:hypothetical protein
MKDRSATTVRTLQNQALGIAVMSRTTRLLLLLPLAFWLMNVRTAHACSDVLSTVLADALRPLVEKAPLCSGLRQDFDVGFGFGKMRLGIDKTSEVRLRSFQYCPGDVDSKLAATIYVRCETPPGEMVRFSVGETFDADVTLDNKTCAITAFKIEPRNEIARIVATNLGFSEKVRAEIKRHISVICHPAE